MATRQTKTRRRLALAAVLTASAAVTALSARRPRKTTPQAPQPRPKPAPAPRPAPEVPKARLLTPRVKLHRRLTFAAFLTAAAVLAVLSAHEEREDGGSGLSVLGLTGFALVLMAASWLGGWTTKEDYYFPMLFAMLGLSGLLWGGAAVVTEVVLTHRGVPVPAQVMRASLAADGGGTYRLVLLDGSTLLLGDLHADVTFAEGERLTVLVDRGRFVRAMLPEEVDPAVPAAFVLGGAGVLGVTVLRYGYPLRRLSSG
ncbi:hypothetical protein [Amycolatopsis tolypomycina]|uniref:Uncharacterized protein n=1 Tax=Amycolatopsis tolypomycina TaxID=208445 RepID=A0A1H4IFA0_9PSEU|nr:hypothetical protein [Amycolatopsis tolypomycina]SEB32018.1 hypothetical protein SAMN04489727_0375 [Amycolatopsis tolypomycina]